MAKRYGLVIDQERCIGCHACTVACKVEHAIDEGSWIKVETVGGASMDTARGKYPELTMCYTLHFCQHCANPPCRDACPVEAISQRPDGIVLIDKDKCNGCRACLDACPYDAISFNEESNLAEKCTLCAHRIDQGLEPLCVACCEGEAMRFGDLADPSSEPSKLLARRPGYTLKPEAGTKPGVHFCPPLPHRKV